MAPAGVAVSGERTSSGWHACNPYDCDLLALDGELFASEATVIAVKTAIPWGFLLLIPALAAAGGSGLALAKGRQAGLVGAKLKRMPLIAANGIVILIPSALFLASKARAAEFDTSFYAVQAPSMRTMLIVFHSLTGGARQMAEAAARGGAAEASIQVRLLEASKAAAADVLHADGYIFATPENLAAIAGIMKDFFDRTCYAALDRISGRPYAIMVCAGSDGQSAVRQIERIATGWRLRPIADPIIIRTNAQTPEAIFAPKLISPQDLSRCEELGAALAAGLTLGIF